MKIEPKDLLERLEFDKIQQMLVKECFGEAAKTYFQQIRPIDSFQLIESMLYQVRELKLLLGKGERFPVSGYEAIDEELKMLGLEGYVLSLEGIIKIRNILQITKEIFKFFTPVRKEIYPCLYQVIAPLHFEEPLLTYINQVMDEAGVIRSDASPGLVRIRKQMSAKQKELDSVFKKVVANYRNKGWLTDNIESFRNGRRVLSAPSEHKRKIRGIIHDESATGKTAFIEPEEVIIINNDIFDLEMEEKQEIYLILKELCAKLSPNAQHLAIYQSLVAEYDKIHAKALLALKMKANMPVLKEGPHIGIKNGYHPLLYLKNKLYGKKTVPFELRFFQGNRILLVSGPNAGGKSILMKSVGLLQLMLQCGLLVPVSENAEMGIFESMFADIGDQQSLEDDLSTYSSKLKNMKLLLEKANAQSLVLIDEFGSGTDPNIGGAIAEGILKELNHLKVYGVMTTHFSNLKIFAFNTPGIINGSMYFDRQNLTPTFELNVGRPGSSYAFEIAAKTGLDKKVLAHARHKIGHHEKAVDELLIDLQNERKELEEKLKSIGEKEKLLDKLVKNYDSAHNELEVRRRKLKIEAKELLLQQSAKETRELENLVKELKTNKKLEEAQKLVQVSRIKRASIGEEIVKLEDDIVLKQEKTVEKVLEAGDYVRVKNGGAIGKVEKLNNKEAVVLIGDMRMTIKTRDLNVVNQPLEIQKKRVTTNMIDSGAQFSPNLDIRGMSSEEGIRILETFFDQAIVTNVKSLRVLHGKGTGVLRTLVRKKAKEYKEFIKISHPEQNEGGDGVTIIEM